MNQAFIKEKKATNAIIASSRKESAEVLEIAKSLIQQSKLLKRDAEEMKAKEKVDMTKLARIERINYSKKLKVVKESFLREKKEKQELMINIKQMEEKQNALTDELLALKNLVARSREGGKARRTSQVGKK